ncbi:MAG: hypothetical protein KDH86_18755, partial [Anaerolineae bacterium]|nr:hypothetical protein [Anaerolineae bacterium]
MKQFRLFTLAAILIVAAMVLAACPSGQTGDQAPATTEAVAEPTAAPEQPTVAPEPTAAPEATVAEAEPTEAPMDDAAMAEGMSFGLESCDGFDGIVQKVVAVDDMTVEFDLCKPDPAFLSKVAFSAFGIQPSEWIESTGGT